MGLEKTLESTPSSSAIPTAVNGEDAPTTPPPERSPPRSIIPTAEPQTRYPAGLNLTVSLVSLMKTMLLVALRRLIIATAVPRITDDFRSAADVAAADVAWYASSFLLTNAALQLIYGKLYTLWSVKRIFVASMLLFELRSAVFIFERALSGMAILVHSAPLHRRPMFQGLFGVTFRMASFVLGGAFTMRVTTKVTWRWCFYINLPLGGIVLAGAFLEWWSVKEWKENRQSRVGEDTREREEGSTVLGGPKECGEPTTGSGKDSERRL